MKKISTDLLFKVKPLAGERQSLYSTAHGAYNCCREQDLHLFKYNEIYEEKRLSLKEVKGWKIGKALSAKKHLDNYVNQMKTGRSNTKTPYSVKMILVGEEKKRQEEEEKQIKEHLSLEKEQKDRRNYQTRNTTFI